MTSLQADPDTARWLALSDEPDQWLRRLLAAERAASERDRADGYAEGWAAAEAAVERDHQALAVRVLAIADPGGPEARQEVDRRLRAAEAACRQMAAAHWRARWAELYRLSRDERFLREARMKPWHKQSYGQQMALFLNAKRRAAA